MGSKKQATPAAKPVTPMSYKKEAPEDAAMIGGGRSLGAQYATAKRMKPVSGGGFGGQKQTLG